MANTDDLKRKAKNALGALADVSREAYKLAGDTAYVLKQKAKIKAEVSREKAEIRHLYSELGKLYYKTNKDKPEAAFKELCKDITSSYELISEKKREYEDLVSSFGEGDSACCCEDVETECCAEDEQKPAAKEPKKPAKRKSTTGTNKKKDT